MTKAQLQMVMDVSEKGATPPFSLLDFNIFFFFEMAAVSNIRTRTLRHQAHANGGDKHKFYPNQGKPKKALKAKKHEMFA